MGAWSYAGPRQETATFGDLKRLIKHRLQQKIEIFCILTL